MTMLLNEFRGLGTIDPMKVPAAITNPKSLIEWITFRSNLTPEIKVDRPLEGSSGNVFLEMMKPELQVKLSIDSSPIVVAPFGSPSTSLRFIGPVAFAAGLALAVYGAFTLIKRW